MLSRIRREFVQSEREDLHRPFGSATSGPSITTRVAVRSPRRVRGAPAPRARRSLRARSPRDSNPCTRESVARRVRETAPRSRSSVSHDASVCSASALDHREQIARAVLQLGDQHRVGLLGALALGDVEHDAMEAHDASLIEDVLPRVATHAFGSPVHADDAILDVADAVAFGIDALAERRLNAVAVLGMDPADENARSTAASAAVPTSP